jgi:1-acyl-sn-glycerol-3-phosphate acyltransferase
MSSIDVPTTLIAPPRDADPSPRPAPAPRDIGCRVPGLFARLNYRVGQLIGRFVFFMTMNVRTVRPHLADRQGGYVLACTHLSHVEPLVVGVLVDRKIDFLSRIEFFRNRLAAAYLWSIDAFPVKRFSFTGWAIRTAINRAAAGRAVGIFPEGGVATGRDSVCRGGPIKRGACVIALRANVPIIPCVVVGTEELNRVLPWVPWRRGRLWVAFGEPVVPRVGYPRRAARFEMAEELKHRFAALYDELRAKHELPDGHRFAPPESPG